MEQFGNKFKNHTTRLKGYDYGSNGIYFVTICTLNKAHYFGEIVGTDYCSSVEKDDHVLMRKDHCPSLRYTPMGVVAREFWLEIPKHYDYVELDEFVIMPNHIHGILKFNRPEYTSWNPNKFGPQSGNLGAVIRAYKASVKRYANNNGMEFNWQSRFYDRIIRDGRSLLAARTYIEFNPANWKEDEINLTY